MSPQEFLKYVKAEPFRAFRIRMNSGRTFDIRHPEMIRVTKHALVVFSSVSDNLEIYDDWESVSPLLVETVSLLEAPVS